MSPSLSVVSADGKVAALDRTNSNDAVAERVRRLQAAARGLVLEPVRALEAALHDVERLSKEIAGGGFSAGDIQQIEHVIGLPGGSRFFAYFFLRTSLSM